MTTSPPVGRGGSTSLRIALAVTVACATVTAVLWIQLIGAGIDSGWELDHRGIELGRDLRAFAHAGALVADGRPTAIYDPTGYIEIGASDFQNPPFYVLPFVPLSAISMPLLWFVWAGITYVAIVLALRALGVCRATLIGGALLLTAPVFTGIRFGQNFAMTLLLLALGYRLLARRRQRAAGAVAGLLAYKPHFLAGLGLWWLLDRSRRPALWWCLATIGGLVALSWLLIPEAWPAFFARLDGISELYAGASPVVQFTSWHMIRSLLPWIPSAGVSSLWLIWCLAAAAAFAWFLRRVSGHLEASYAASVVFPLLVAPHIVVYDWVVLVIPVALLWRAFPDHRPTWATVAAALVAAALLGAPLAVVFGLVVGVQVPVATICLLAASVTAGRTVIGAVEEGRSASPHLLAETP